MMQMQPPAFGGRGLGTFPIQSPMRQMFQSVLNAQNPSQSVFPFANPYQRSAPSPLGQYRDFPVSNAYQQMFQNRLRMDPQQYMYSSPYRSNEVVNYQPDSPEKEGLLGGFGGGITKIDPGSAILGGLF